MVEYGFFLTRNAFKLFVPYFFLCLTLFMMPSLLKSHRFHPSTLNGSQLSDLMAVTRLFRRAKQRENVTVLGLSCCNSISI